MTDKKSNITPERDTEHRILEAARGEFVSRGFSGARMQAIAERAGVNKSLLHYYFRSKKKLYDRILGDIVRGIWDQVRVELNSISNPDDPRQYIRALVATYIHVLSANPDFPRLFFREVIDGGTNLQHLFGDLFPTFGDVPRRIVDVLVDGMSKGTVRRMHPAHIMINILGMTAATFLFGDLIRLISTVAGRPLSVDSAFMEQRIDAITEMASDGIFIK